MFRCLVICLSVLSFTSAINDGDMVEWNRNAYLVKILTTLPDERTVACTGSLVSPSLVITSSKCYQDVESSNLNSYVMSVRGNGTQAWRRKVRSIEIRGNIAVVEIKPRRTEQICPAAPAPVRGARLPLTPSLIESSWKTLDLEELSEKKCRITGFETVPVSAYLSSFTLLRISVDLSTEFEMMIAPVFDERAPCWDDLGLPLECELEENIWTQVGILHSTTTTGSAELENINEEECPKVTGMRFAMFNEDLPVVLNKMAPAEIFSTYTKCFSRN